MKMSCNSLRLSEWKPFALFLLFISLIPQLFGFNLKVDTLYQGVEAGTSPADKIVQYEVLFKEIDKTKDKSKWKVR